MQNKWKTVKCLSIHITQAKQKKSFIQSQIPVQVSARNALREEVRNLEKHEKRMARKKVFAKHTNHTKMYAKQWTCITTFLSFNVFC